MMANFVVQCGFFGWMGLATPQDETTLILPSPPVAALPSGGATLGSLRRPRRGVRGKDKAPLQNKIYTPRHVVCVALTEVSPRVLHFKIWPETIALGMFQRIATVLLNLLLPDFIEISRDFSSVKIHLDKIFLPLPGEPSLVALPDLFHVQRFGFHSGSPGAVGVDFEIMSSTPQ
jgi:hypothetical protein